MSSELLAYCHEINTTVKRDVRGCVNQPVHRNEIKQARALLDESIEDLRKLSHELHRIDRAYYGAQS